MQELKYTIGAEVFARFPGYVRGVVVAHGVRNGDAPEDLVRMLRDAEALVRARLSLERVSEEPRIKSWREAYRAFGAKPSEFRSAVEALARRVLRGDPLPAINILVDLGNLVCLRHLLPVGGHAIDVLSGDICLRPAVGDETFTPFGSERAESPLPGEIVFVEGGTVLTRRWTWRQANHTLTLPTTRAIVFNLDGLPPVTPAEVAQAGAELAELVTRFCGGRTRCGMLTDASPEIGLEP